MRERKQAARNWAELSHDQATARQRGCGPRSWSAAADLTPVDHMAQLGCPLLVVGDGADRYTTVDNTQRLFTAAREPKDLWMIPGAAHVDFLEFAGDAYRGELRRGRLATSGFF